MKMYQRQWHKKRSSGFSLVELLVSMSIFTTVAVAAVGALLVMIDSNRKAQNIQSAMTNLSFALDSMTREIRTGSDYYCGGEPEDRRSDDCLNGHNLLFIKEGGGSLTADCSAGDYEDRIGYDLKTSVNGNGQIVRSLCTPNPNSWVPITSDEVDITTLEFTVTGTDFSNENYNPLVTIYIEGAVNGIRGTGANFNLQTTVAQQLLDI